MDITAIPLFPPYKSNAYIGLLAPIFHEEVITTLRFYSWIGSTPDIDVVILCTRATIQLFRWRIYDLSTRKRIA